MALFSQNWKTTGVELVLPIAPFTRSRLVVLHRAMLRPPSPRPYQRLATLAAAAGCADSESAHTSGCAANERHTAAGCAANESPGVASRAAGNSLPPPIVMPARAHGRSFC